MNLFLISPADAAQPAEQSSQITFFEPLLIVGIIAIFYFLIWRPQSKRAREHRELVAGLSKNDEIITNGGIYGRIAEIEDDFLTVRIAKDTEILIQRNAVSATLPQGTLKSIDKKD